MPEGRAGLERRAGGAYYAGMERYDFRTQRLFVDTPLDAGHVVDASRAQANYLINVLRLRDGAAVLLFNGADGEWLTRIEVQGRKACRLIAERQTRKQPEPAELTYCFAPLKQARLDYMLQKAVEMGAGRLQPVITQHTQISKINLDRMRANAIEAAEQCGILSVPEVRAPVALADYLRGLNQDQQVVFCDEAPNEENAAEQLSRLRTKRLAVLVGPEGGFSDTEREMLAAYPQIVRISLGPRILRADTAAVAALALVQAMAGDWFQ